MRDQHRDGRPDLLGGPEPEEETDLLGGPEPGDEDLLR